MDEARLFVGLELGDAARDALYAFCDQFDQALEGNLYEKDLYHLTLCFLGRTALSRLGELHAALDSVVKPRMTLSLGELGTFKRDTILWIGVEEPCEALYQLQTRLSQALTAAGFPVEDAPYVPHITLGRKMRLRAPLPMAPRALFEVNCATLFESVRVGARLIYRPIYRSY